MNIIYSTPVYEAETRKGSKKFWQGHVSSDGTDWFTQTSFWQETKDGLSLKQTSEPTLILGKNIGKANETTPEKQAYAELESTTNKQIDKGYHLDGEKSNTKPLPMLAEKWKDCSHKMVGEMCVQPKLDGNRALYDGHEMWSRAGKANIPEVYHHLRFETEGYIIDGEIMLPKPYTFQQTMTAVKKFRLNLSPKIQYYVFDIVDENLSFKERYKILKRLVEAANNPSIVLVPTYPLTGKEQVMEFQDKFVAMGHEGIIIRASNGKYRIGHRDSSLQKFKYFEEDEFEVVDVEDGKGKNAGVAKFICKTKEGKTFSADYNAPVEERKEIFRNKEDYIGKFLIVRYQEMSDDNIPRFNKAISIRDYELQGG